MNIKDVSYNFLNDYRFSNTNVIGDNIGYIKVIDCMGDDKSIIESARMSTQKGFLGWGSKPECRYCGSEVQQKVSVNGGCSASGLDCDMSSYGPPGDEKLLKYLWTHKHSTPFEFCELVVEVKAPIFVFREWHRHRTQSYNEMSARYIPLPDENYIPTIGRVLLNSSISNNKQSSSNNDTVIDVFGASQFIEELKTTYDDCEVRYQYALKRGVPKELARLHIPVGRYSVMRAKANLRNWIAFLTLRMDKNAQWEIRQYANAISDFIEILFPRTHHLFIGNIDTGA